MFVLIALGVGAAVYAHNKNQPTEKRGSAAEEFVTDAAPEPKPPPKRQNPRPWPTYGYDAARTHISPYDHRPPYRRLWAADAHDTLEFPPTIGYGRLYMAQQKGLFFALDAKTGKVDWRKSLHRCAASSPTIGDGVVTSPTCTPSCASRTSRGRTGSSSRGTPTPAGSGGASRRRRSSPRRCCATVACTWAPGTTRSTR